jgi:hypothetical protein
MRPPQPPRASPPPAAICIPGFPMPKRTSSSAPGNRKRASGVLGALSRWLSAILVTAWLRDRDPKSTTESQRSVCKPRGILLVIPLLAAIPLEDDANACQFDRSSTTANLTDRYSRVKLARRIAGKNYQYFIGFPEGPSHEHVGAAEAACSAQGAFSLQAAEFLQSAALASRSWA